MGKKWMWCCMSNLVQLLVWSYIYKSSCAMRLPFRFMHALNDPLPKSQLLTPDGPVSRRLGWGSKESSRRPGLHNSRYIVSSTVTLLVK